MLWRNWYAHAGSNASAQAAIEGGFPDSVVGIGRIVAENPVNGDVVFDASSLFGDNLDMHNILAETPMGKSYRLDPALSYVDAVKAFPENDVITIAQTWTTDEKHQYDAAPDARRVLIRVVYNLIGIPQSNYRPRLMDDRIGLYDDIYTEMRSRHRVSSSPTSLQRVYAKPSSRRHTEHHARSRRRVRRPSG